METKQTRREKPIQQKQKEAIVTSLNEKCIPINKNYPLGLHSTAFLSGTPTLKSKIGIGSENTTTTFTHTVLRLQKVLILGYITVHVNDKLQNNFRAKLLILT